MSDRPTVPLRPVLTEVESPEYKAISGWRFDGANAYVSRLLRDDVPRSVQFQQGQVWIYLDPGGQLVGFGVIDVCDEYDGHTAGLPHPYLRLLAVNPSIQSRGYGTSIVQHLIGQAVVFVRRGGCAQDVYLAVYKNNERGIGLYKKLGFVTVGDESSLDPLEGDRPYIVIARRAALISGVLPLFMPPGLP